MLEKRQNICIKMDTTIQPYNPCNDTGCYYPNTKICESPSLKDRDYCFHQPPIEMSLKLVGMSLP